MHAARALNLYWGYRDYDSALAELEIASRALPNDPELFRARGWIVRRQGRSGRGRQNLEHAIELDPRNVYRLLDVAKYTGSLRRYAKEEAVLDRVMVLRAGTMSMRSWSARVWKPIRGEANLIPADQIMDSNSGHKSRRVVEYRRLLALGCVGRTQCRRCRTR